VAFARSALLVRSVDPLRLIGHFPDNLQIDFDSTQFSPSSEHFSPPQRPDSQILPITNDVRAEPTGSPERPHSAGGGAPAGGPSRRFSAPRQLEAVGRLMRGEPPELVARELNVTAARLCAWQDRALLGAGSALKDRERDRRTRALDRHRRSRA